MAATVITTPKTDITIKESLIVERQDSFKEIQLILVCVNSVLHDYPENQFGTPTAADIGRWLIAHSEHDKLKAACEIAEQQTNNTKGG